LFVIVTVVKKESNRNMHGSQTRKRSS